MDRLTLPEVLTRYGSHAAARRALGHITVPTVADLVTKGLATKVLAGKRAGTYRLSIEGQQVITNALRHNSQIRPQLPPDSTHPGRKRTK